MVAPRDLPALGEPAMTGRSILTAEAMRAAEQAAIDGGTSVEQLMEGDTSFAAMIVEANNIRRQ